MGKRRKIIHLSAFHFCFLFMVLFLFLFIRVHFDNIKGNAIIPYIEEMIPEGIASNLEDEGLLFILFHNGEEFPSRQMEINLNRLAEDLGREAGYYKINGLENESLCIEYNISGFPSVIILKNGEEANRILGVTSYSNLKHIYSRVR